MIDRQVEKLVIVAGYLPNVDELPREARRLGLEARLAFSLESYRPNQTDPYFDTGIYEAVLRTIWRVVVASEAEIVRESGGSATVTSWDALSAMVRRELTSVGDPYSRILFRSGRQVVALLLYEPRVNFGGPRPYHDNYVVPLYTAQDLRTALVGAVEDEVAPLGVQLGPVWVSPARPEWTFWAAVRAFRLREFLIRLVRERILKRE